MQLLDLFEEWQKALSDLNSLLKEQVKARGQAKVLAQIKITDHPSSAQKSMSRSSYNARLLHPQHWPLSLLEQFANVLACPELLILWKKQRAIINQLPDRLTSYIKTANTSNAFVIRKLNINQATFYARQKDPANWKKTELETIEKVIETLKAL